MVCGKMLGAGDLDDGTIIGFVLVVTAGPSLGLGRVCVPAGLKTAAKGRKGPGEFFFWITAADIQSGRGNPSKWEVWLCRQSHRLAAWRTGIE